jgi:predicted TIM-barrel fold metal-dependent hydrolase
MLGSDYPFDMGIRHPTELIARASLGDADRENILHRSAEEFLNLS